MTEGSVSFVASALANSQRLHEVHVSHGPGIAVDEPARVGNKSPEGRPTEQPLCAVHRQHLVWTGSCLPVELLECCYFNFIMAARMEAIAIPSFAS
jgi:hypothetical protein